MTIQTDAEKATTGARRLLEDDAPIAPAESTQAWFSAGATERLSAWIKLIARRPERAPCSHATEQTAHAIQEHIETHWSDDEIDVSMLPISVPIPLFSLPTACWFLMLAALLLLVAPLQKGLCLLLLMALVIGATCEMLGLTQFSRLWVTSTAGHCLELSMRSGASFSDSTDETPQVLVLWAALDTPPTDLLYHPRRWEHYLRPLYRTRLLPAAIVLMSMWFALCLMWWWLFSSKSAVGWFAVVWAFVLLACACGLGWLTEDAREEGAQAAAIAVAIEAFQRLHQVALPCDVKLVLVGASQAHMGISSWLRQRESELPAVPTMFGILPLGHRASSLSYASHHGLLWPRPVSSELGRLGDWTSARMAALTSQDAGRAADTSAMHVPHSVPRIEARQFYGSTPALSAGVFGVSSFLIGDCPRTGNAALSATSGHAALRPWGVESPTLTPDEAVASVSLDSLDAAAAFLVALAQAQALEREAAREDAR